MPLKALPPDTSAGPLADPEWLHEIEHDGFRMLAQRDGERVRLISRRGLGDRFPLIVAAVEGTSR